MNNFYWLVVELGAVFLFPLLIILITTPYLIKKLIKKGNIVKDYYKKGNMMVPTGGGIAIMLAVLFSMSLNSLFYKFDATNYVVPNNLTLKWVLPYYRNVTERQATYAMYAVTSVFCIIGILIPG